MQLFSFFLEVMFFPMTVIYRISPGVHPRALMELTSGFGSKD